MKMKRMIEVAGIMVAAMAVPGVLGQSITNLGYLPGNSYTYPQTISADGAVVLGNSYGDSGSKAFRWTRAAGIQALESPPFAGGQVLQILGGSDDLAKVLVSFSNRMGVWSGGPNYQEVASAGILADISKDGSTVVWLPYDPQRPFRWRTNSGTEDLGARSGGRLTLAWNVSADGSVVVGRGQPVAGSGGSYQAAIWRSDGTFVALGTLPGHNSSEGLCISADGLVVVGTSYGPNATGFRWSAEAGMTSLGNPVGVIGSYPDAMSGDALTVVGECVIDSASGVFRELAVWRPATGMMRLSEFLVLRGIDISGWSFTESETIRISTSGRHIAGIGAYLGVTAGFIVDLGAPCHADITEDRRVDGADIGALLAHWGSVYGDPAAQMADINRDGIVNGADLGLLLSNWGPCSN